MDSENISLGPGGRPGAWAQGASGGGSSRFALPGEGESRQGNRFSALSGGDAGVHRQDGKGRSIQRKYAFCFINFLFFWDVAREGHHLQNYLCWMREFSYIRSLSVIECYGATLPLPVTLCFKVSDYLLSLCLLISYSIFPYASEFFRDAVS